MREMVDAYIGSGFFRTTYIKEGGKIRLATYIVFSKCMHECMRCKSIVLFWEEGGCQMRKRERKVFISFDLGAPTKKKRKKRRRRRRRLLVLPYKKYPG